MSDKKLEWVDKTVWSLQRGLEKLRHMREINGKVREYAGLLSALSGYGEQLKEDDLEKIRNRSETILAFLHAVELVGDEPPLYRGVNLLLDEEISYLRKLREWQEKEEFPIISHRERGISSVSQKRDAVP